MPEDSATPNNSIRSFDGIVQLRQVLQHFRSGLIAIVARSMALHAHASGPVPSFASVGGVMP